MPQHKINTSTQESEQYKKRLQQIGLYIREIRIIDGLTQVEAAKSIGICVGCIQNIEHGNNVSVLTLLKISDAYDIRISDFFMDLD